MRSQLHSNMAHVAQSAVLTFLFFVLPVQSFAATAPGTLSNIPLFLSTSALPNIFFMVDDSISMDSDMVTPEQDKLSGVSGSEGQMPVPPGVNTGPRYGYMYATYASDNVSNYSIAGVAPTQESVDTAGETDAYLLLTGVWRARCKDYNKIYYDPSVDYKPWSGVDSTGATYADATYTSVYTDPYNRTGSVNLTSTQYITTKVPNVAGGDGSVNFSFSYMPMRYWEWTDTNDDDVVDASDGHTLVEIVSTKSKCGDGQTPGADGCLTRAYADEAKNFANWWQYHRRREYAIKSAMGSVVAATNSVRMGIASINTNSSYSRQMEEMNNDVTTGNKLSLMNTIYTVQSSGYSTPLKGALNKAGDYYACTGEDPFGFSTNCPIETGGTYPAGRCQQNFTILFTDGYYSDTVSGINNADNDGSSWSDDGKTYKFDQGPYKDTASNTLADIAMHYYERDLNGDLDNKVPTTCGVDENPGQHMVTYTVGFGVEGNLTESDLPSNPRHESYANGCTAASTASTPVWPDDPAANNASKVDDLLHAAYNGRGYFYASSNATTLTQNLQGAIDDVLSRSGSASAVSFNSTSLGTDTHAYLATFDSSRWSGDLKSYSLDPYTGVIASTEDWKAATKLNGKTPSNRVILTYDGSDGIPFTYDYINTNLSTSDIIRLDMSYASGNEQKRIDYIRGDRTNEGTGEKYRIRESRLGDIVHSTPIYVGKPYLKWPDTVPFPTAEGERYSDFKTAQYSRGGVIYVGSNDGMLHGFRESDGEEVLAYIPRSLFSSADSAGLHYLSDPTYGHRYYVDFTPAVSDVYIDSDWHTVIVGSLGGGGKGIFALDVTNPSAFSEANADDIVMWEFDSSDSADLGYTYSQPIIARMNNGKWAAIFGNGYNSTNGVAKLFIVYLNPDLSDGWTEGDDYVVISTDVGDAVDKNGLSSPGVIDTNGDGVADRIYAGDLKGNMWVFDVSASNTGQWSSAYKSGSGANAVPKALFTGNSNQPITTAPLIAYHPTVESNSTPNYMIYFGTGQYLTTSDVGNTDMQSYYAVWDKGTGELGRANLVKVGLKSGVSGNGGDFRVMDAVSVDYTSKYGWYMDFDADATPGFDSGERVVVDSVLRGDNIYFNTIVPSQDPCASGGWSWLMVVNMSNGGPPTEPAFDFNGDGEIDEEDKYDGNSVSGDKDDGLSSKSSFLGDNQYTSNTDTDDGKGVKKRKIESLDDGKTGRLSWEELFEQ